MSAVFRLNDGASLAVSDHWDFRAHVGDIVKWLSFSENRNQVVGSVLDIGFNSRLSEKIVVQGEELSVEFMRDLADLNVTLWLSIYSPFSHKDS